MSYYRVKYNIDTFQSPHYRYYHAANSATALNMFEEATEQELVGYDTSVLAVSEVRELADTIVECGDSECCQNDCQ